MQTIKELTALRQLVETTEKANRAEREARRAEALGKLKTLDKEEAKRFAEIDKRLAVARKEAAAARVTWQKTEAAAAKIRQERAVAGARADVRRQRLLADVQAAVPEPVEAFIADAARELTALGRLEPAVREVPGGLVERALRLVGQSREWEGNGPALVARGRALVEAMQAARAIAGEDLSPDELTARLTELRESIPEVGFVRLAGRPLDARPVDTV
jgi:hypothetical protein